MQGLGDPGQQLGPQGVVDGDAQVSGGRQEGGLGAAATHTEDIGDTQRGQPLLHTHTQQMSPSIYVLSEFCCGVSSLLEDMSSLDKDYRSTGLQVYGSSGLEVVYGSSGLQVFGSTGLWVFRSTGIQFYTP